MSFNDEGYTATGSTTLCSVLRDCHAVMVRSSLHVKIGRPDTLVHHSSTGGAQLQHQAIPDQPEQIPAVPLLQLYAASHTVLVF